uniref:G-protein coupled receptors family 1 profile domain-containing protein n=1 Tax=Plectus sambesii TaxID=2011161 RepID=A0A914VJF9_9BILA
MAVSVVEGCFLTGSTIALIVYLLFLYTIAVNRNRQPFHSPFFALTFSLGVADVLQLLHTYVFLRFPSFGWLTDAVYLRLSLPVVNYASCAMWGIAFTQHVFVFVLAANRCSAIVFPHNHGQRWSTKVTGASIAISWVTGLIFITPKIFFSKEVYYRIIDNDTREATIVWGAPGILRYYVYLSFGMNGTINVLCFACYAAIFYTACHRQMTSLGRRHKLPLNKRKTTMDGLETTVTLILSSPSQPRSPLALLNIWQKRELKLAFCGFLIFVFMFIYGLGVGYMSIDGSPKTQDARRGVWLATSDIFSGINPFLVLGISKSVRKCFFETITCSSGGADGASSTNTTQCKSIKEQVPRPTPDEDEQF